MDTHRSFKGAGARKAAVWAVVALSWASCARAAELDKLRHTNTASVIPSVNITEGRVTGLKRILSPSNLDTPWFTIYDENAKRDYKIYVRTDTKILKGKKRIKRPDLFRTLQIGDRLYVRHSNNRDGWQIAYTVKFLPPPKKKPAAAAAPASPAEPAKSPPPAPAAKS